MKHKNAFWFSITLTACIAITPMIAQGAQQDRGQQSPPLTKSQSPLLKVQPPPPYMDLNGKDAQRTIPGAYRLTYTLMEMDGERRVGSQKYQIVLDADAPSTSLNAGTRIPIETTATTKDNTLLPGQTQISYVDVGVHIRARLRQFANGIELNSRVDRSSVDSPQPHLSTPVIRQATIDNTVLLTEGKPVVIGNADIPGSTHSLQVQVELTRVP